MKYFCKISIVYLIKFTYYTYIKSYIVKLCFLYYTYKIFSFLYFLILISLSCFAKHAIMLHTSAIFC